MPSDLKPYRWTYKKARGHKLKIVTVMATDDRDAHRQAPVSLTGGWKLYGFLGEAQ